MKASLVILVVSLFIASAQAQYSGGSGIPEDPYRIATAADLLTLGETPGDYHKHFKLMADIDLSGHVYDRAVIAPDRNDVGKGFEGTPFTGVLEGNGHVVRNLHIQGGGHVGLFGQLGSGARISNLGAEAVDVIGTGRHAGGLVGFNRDSSITSCYTTGSVSGDFRVGGLVGLNWGDVVHCYSTGAVSGNEDVGGFVGCNGGSIAASYSSVSVSGTDGTGGLVGRNEGAIRDCYSRGDVSGIWDVGGLVGLNWGDVVHCYSTGAVSGISDVGGLVGYNEGAIKDCYSRGDVSGIRDVGGLVGVNGGGVVHCYSTGAVTGSTRVGGLVGGGWEQVTDCFWDLDTSRVATSPGGTGKSTTEMQAIDAYLTAGWDFIDETRNGTDDIWWIDEGLDYPRLVWESPHPHNGAKNVMLSPTLSWFATREAVSHDIYFGDNEDEVARATTESPDVYCGRQLSEATTYEPGLLEWGKNYYWRIDEVDETDFDCLRRGDVWHFTTVPFAWPIEDIVATSNADWVKGSGPEHTIDGSGLNNEDQHSAAAADMWLSMPAGIDPVYIQYQFDRVYKLHEMLVWNWNEQFEPILGYGVKDMIVAYSEDGMDWRSLREMVLDQAPGEDTYTCGTTVDLGGVPAQYVRLSVKSTYGMRNQVGLSEVRFLYIPVWAYDPWPADGATEVTVDSLLTWCAGREAVWHEVYLSTDQTALGSESTLIDRTQHDTVEAGSLNLATTYYWQVNEASEAEAVRLWEGDVWHFTTQEYLVIDDFESYNDDDNYIFETWLDGWFNETGSTVGYFTFPHPHIVHDGQESMSYYYDNIGPPYYSEAYRTWGLPQDWASYGADTLRLYFHGDMDNSPDPFYVGLEDSAGRIAVVVHPDPNAMLATGWVEWNIPLSDFADVNLAGVTKTYLGINDRDNPQPGGEGLIFIDDIQLCCSPSPEP